MNPAALAFGGGAPGGGRTLDGSEARGRFAWQMQHVLNMARPEASEWVLMGCAEVRPVRVELTTNGLKGRCSTTELQARVRHAFACLTPMIEPFRGTERRVRPAARP